MLVGSNTKTRATFLELAFVQKKAKLKVRPLDFSRVKGLIMTDESFVYDP